MSLRGAEGITHLHYSGTPLWRFGHSESYTSFEIAQSDSTPDSATSSPDDYAVSAHHATVEELAAQSKDQLPSYTVEVTNTGVVEGGLTLMGFVTCNDKAVVSAGFPRQRLFGFQGLKQKLAPGESASIRLRMPTAQQLSVADEHGHSYLHPGSYTVHLGAPPGSKGATFAVAAGALEVPLLLEGAAPKLLRAPQL